MSPDTLPHTGFPLIQVRQLKGDVLYSRPEVNPQQVEQKIAEWVAKQGKHWPDRLSAEYLTANLRIVYVPHLVLDGKGSGQWSASIGTDHQVQVLCNNCQGKPRWKDVYGEWHTCVTCGGTGNIQRTETQWRSQSGMCSGSVSHHIEENFNKGTLPALRSGKRSAKTVTLPSPPLDGWLFSPLNVSTAQGEALAHQLVERSLSRDADHQASRLGQVRNLRTVTLQTQGIRAVHWLYPYYMGTFIHEDQAHVVQMDAITGGMHVQIPASIKSARTQDILRIAVPIALIALIIFAVIFGWNTLTTEQRKIEAATRQGTLQAQRFFQTQTQRALPQTPTLPTRVAGAASAATKFSSIQIASQIKSADGCAADSRDDFLETAEKIYITGRVSNLPAGAQISALWTREGQIAYRSNSWVAPQAYQALCVWVYIEPREVNFLPGRWTVQLMLNGEPVGEAQPFLIRARITAVPTKAPTVRPTIPPPSGTPAAGAMVPSPISALYARMQILGGTWKRDPSGEVNGSISNGSDGLLLFEEDYTDFSLSAQVKAMDREASFAVRMQDSKNLYLVVFSPSNAQGATPGVHLRRRLNGKEEILKSNTSITNLPQRGEWASLKVEAEGSRIRVYLNDRLVISHTDPSTQRFSKGKVGLRIAGDSRYPCNAFFRQITVIPSQTSILSVRMQILGGNWKRNPSGEITGTSTNGDGLLLFEKDYTDFSLSAQVKSADREASFAFWMQDRDNGYLVVFAPSNARGATPGVYLVRRVKGNETELKSNTTSLPRRGEWASLKVETEGSRIRVYLNDRLVISHTDPSTQRFSKGRVGFRIYGDSRYPCNAFFRQIDLR